MVSQSVLYAITFQFLVSFLVPIILIIYLKKKNKLSWKSVGVGILVFLVFVNILERTLHSFVLNPENSLLTNFSDNPFFYVLYAILSAALFEEFGRFLGFKFFLKDKRSLGDGLSYGLGHGGVEVITIGVLGSITGFLMFGMINNGELSSALSSQATAEQIESIKNQFIETPAYFYVLSGLERVAALAMQIFLSLLVLLGVKKSGMIYVWYAVFLHAVFNVAPALYQINAITNVLVAEAIIMVMGVAAIYGIKRISIQFQQNV